MSKRIEAKYKINRRLGVNLWGRSKSPLAKGREIATADQPIGTAGGTGRGGVRRHRLR